MPARKMFEFWISEMAFAAFCGRLNNILNSVSKAINRYNVHTNVQFLRNISVQTYNAEKPKHNHNHNHTI